MRSLAKQFLNSELPQNYKADSARGRKSAEMNFQSLQTDEEMKKRRLTSGLINTQILGSEKLLAVETEGKD